MKDNVHIVLDLETMGKGPRAAITAIGAAMVMHNTVASTFYRKVDLASSAAMGGEITPSTVEWWLMQDVDARTAMVQPGMHLATALCDLRDFIGREPSYIWGNGCMFDNAILLSAYEMCAIEAPWDYRRDRDLRTLLALYPKAKDIEFTGTIHNAQDDAVHQAKQLIAALKLHYAE